MEQDLRASLWLSLDGNTQWEDVDSLLEMLTDTETGVLAEPAGAGPGFGDIVVGVMVFATMTTTLVNQLLDIAEKLGRFRKGQQQQGKTGRIRIERSNGDKIEIEGYSAEEILPMLTTAMYTPQIEGSQESDDDTPSYDED